MSDLPVQIGLAFVRPGDAGSGGVLVLVVNDVRHEFLPSTPSGRLPNSHRSGKLPHYFGTRMTKTEQSYAYLLHLALEKLGRCSQAATVDELQHVRGWSHLGLDERKSTLSRMLVKTEPQFIDRSDARHRYAGRVTIVAPSREDDVTALWEWLRSGAARPTGDNTGAIQEPTVLPAGPPLGVPPGPPAQPSAVLAEGSDSPPSAPAGIQALHNKAEREGLKSAVRQRRRRRMIGAGALLLSLVVIGLVIGLWQKPGKSPCDRFLARVDPNNPETLVRALALANEPNVRSCFAELIKTADLDTPALVSAIAAMGPNSITGDEFGIMAEALLRHTAALRSDAMRVAWEYAADQTQEAAQKITDGHPSPPLTPNDVGLLTRLDAWFGKLPEPQRPIAWNAPVHSPVIERLDLPAQVMTWTWLRECSRTQNRPGFRTGDVVSHWLGAYLGGNDVGLRPAVPGCKPRADDFRYCAEEPPRHPVVEVCGTASICKALPEVVGGRRSWLGVCVGDFEEDVKQAGTRITRPEGACSRFGLIAPSEDRDKPAPATLQMSECPWPENGLFNLFYEHSDGGRRIMGKLWIRQHAGHEGVGVVFPSRFYAGPKNVTYIVPLDRQSPNTGPPAALIASRPDGLYEVPLGPSNLVVPGDVFDVWRVSGETAVRAGALRIVDIEQGHFLGVAVLCTARFDTGFLAVPSLYTGINAIIINEHPGGLAAHLERCETAHKGTTSYRTHYEESFSRLRADLRGRL